MCSGLEPGTARLRVGRCISVLTDNYGDTKFGKSPSRILQRIALSWPRSEVLVCGRPVVQWTRRDVPKRAVESRPGFMCFRELCPGVPKN